MASTSEFGKQTLATMREHHLSMKQVGDAAGIDKQVMWWILRGVRQPSEKEQEAITHTLQGLGISSEAPRVPPSKPLEQMSTKEKRALAADPEHWAWLCYHLFVGTDGTPLRLQTFHVEMLREMFIGGKLVVNLPTDHSKSWIGTFVFPLLSLMNDPNETHIICGANINDSKRRVKALQLELETNTKLTTAYPWLKRPTEKSEIWSAIAFNVIGRTVNKPNPSALAAAIGSSDVRGRRGKLIMDDIEGDKHKWSVTARHQLYDFVKLEAIRCFESRNETKRPLLCCLGTPFTIDSLYFRLESEGWKCIRYPVFKEGSVLRPTQPKNLLWPEKMDKVKDAFAAMDRRQFAVAYLMDPTGGDKSVMSFAEIKERMEKASFDQQSWQTFVSLDPAAGAGGKRADYCGISVVDIVWTQGEKLPHLRVIKALRFEEGLFEQVHTCAALAAENDCNVIYESNSQQGGTYRNAFMHLHPETKLTPHFTTQGNKFDVEMGLTVLKTLLKEELLVAPQSQIDTDGMQSLIQEIQDLGNIGAHDHIACSVWFVIRYMYGQARLYSGPKFNSGFRPTGRYGSGTQFGFGRMQQQRQDPARQAMNEEAERFQRQLLERRR